MRATAPFRRRLVLALFTAGLAALAPGAAAQDRDDLSFTASAAATVKIAAATAFSSAQDLATTALDLIGIRYKWGGETPATGLDCSGLVRYVFQQVTGVTLPRTARDMSRLGDEVAIPDLQPGDLVFFNTRRFAYSHVGIYLGEGRFVHAPSTGRTVSIASFNDAWYRRNFVRAGRMPALKS